jgi:hypothetical protein
VDVDRGRGKKTVVKFNAGQKVCWSVQPFEIKVDYVFQAKTRQFISFMRSYRTSYTNGSVGTYRIEFEMSGTTRVCGTVSCAQIENDSHRVSLDVFSYTKESKTLKGKLNYWIEPLFVYESNLTVEDRVNIPCMVYDPMAKISLHQLSEVRLKFRC